MIMLAQDPEFLHYSAGLFWYAAPDDALRGKVGTFELLWNVANPNIPLQ